MKRKRELIDGEVSSGRDDSKLSKKRAKKKKKKKKKIVSTALRDSLNTSSSMKQTEPASKIFDLLNGKCCVAAPMVNQSELAFRLLMRRHGATVCFTPMILAHKFVESDYYRKSVFLTCKQDRPLVVQLAGNDPEVLLAAARLVQERCDAIDLNLGCPQKVAKKGHYGAFLMENWDLIKRIVRSLSQGLELPLWCKVRCYENDEQTVAYAKMLAQSGCSVLTVHGRTREQRDRTAASWSTIASVKSAVSIPVIANGDIFTADDVYECKRVTSADAYMAARGLLFNPALFDGCQEHFGEQFDFKDKTRVSRPAQYRSRCKSFGAILARCPSSYFDLIRRNLELAHEYLDICAAQPPSFAAIVRQHVYWLLIDSWRANTDLYDLLFKHKGSANLDLRKVSERHLPPLSFQPSLGGVHTKQTTLLPPKSDSSTQILRSESTPKVSYSLAGFRKLLHILEWRAKLGIVMREETRNGRPRSYTKEGELAAPHLGGLGTEQMKKGQYSFVTSSWVAEALKASQNHKHSLEGK